MQCVSVVRPQVLGHAGGAGGDMVQINNFRAIVFRNDESAPPEPTERAMGDRRRGSAGELSRVLLAPLGEIDVLGERQPRKADLDGAGARELHR